ncbi:Gustatory receptor 8 [Hyalella azteca]|uniref:Gustatory receptor 8 n=1 Tax=Hyalella azteca TaxID=294128 RepID=A0A6A0GTR4_HYAAZ|nr:Gustatory receptor 8 [Hyalella azteca]
MSGLRIFGILPYKLVGLRSGRVCSSKPTKMKLKKYRTWQIWSVFLMIAMCVLMGIDIYYATAEPRGALVGFQTMVITHYVYDLGSAVTVAALQVIFWWQGDQLARILNRTNRLGDRIRWSNSVTVFVMAIIVAPSVTNSLVLIMFLEDYVSTLALVALGIKVTSVAFSFLIIGIIYHYGMQVIASHLAIILQPIIDAIKPEVRGQKSDHNLFTLTNYGWEVNDTLDQRTEFQDQIMIAENTTNSNVAITQTVRSKCTWKEYDIKYWKDSILNAYCIHADLKRYCELPLAIVMFCLLIWLLTSAFYITSWGVLRMEQRILSTCYMIVGTAPVFYLLNSSYCLQSKLSELKWSVTFLIHHSSSHQDKVQLTELLELLRSCPPFDVLGVFTMSRARLIDIFSFVATYIVILLQFRLTEITPGAQPTLPPSLIQ